MPGSFRRRKGPRTTLNLLFGLLAESVTSRLCCVALIWVCSPFARAQWTQQQIALKPGWNAVFLEVDPSPKDCDAAFAGLPIESVWDFTRPADSAQFVQDPSTLIPGAAGWLTWFPPSHPLAKQSNLSILRDGRPYLIKLADSARPITWSVTGRPSLRRLEWRPGRVNLVGFHVATNPAPRFAAWFAGEAGLSGQTVYRLGSAGSWQAITDLSSNGPQPGEAYWIRCQAPANRTATIEVDSGSSQGLIFSRGIVEQSLRVRNTSSASRNIAMRLLPSATPPANQAPLAGAAPLEYREANFAQAQFAWQPLTDTLRFAGLAPGAEWNVRLAVRRGNGGAASSGAKLQSILEVTDDAGARWLLPISADTGASAGRAGLLGLSANEPGQTRAGLWMGEAVLNAVSQPAHPSDPLLARRAGGEFQFRLLIHVDAQGAARLLQNVFLVRKPPTYKPDPDNPEVNVVDQPARTVVVTDEALIPGIVGDGDIVGRRASSAAFGFKQPLLLSGSAFGNGTLQGEIKLAYDDPLNPFNHLYHPDHDNLDERFAQKLGEGKESFTVTRTLSLAFTASDPLGLNPPGWGDTEFGGTYRETISGLHRDQLQISGNFRLLQISDSPVLNQ